MFLFFLRYTVGYYSIPCVIRNDSCSNIANIVSSIVSLLPHTYIGSIWFHFLERQPWFPTYTASLKNTKPRRSCGLIVWMSALHWHSISRYLNNLICAIHKGWEHAKTNRARITQEEDTTDNTPPPPPPFQLQSTAESWFRCKRYSHDLITKHSDSRQTAVQLTTQNMQCLHSWQMG